MASDKHSNSNAAGDGQASTNLDYSLGVDVADVSSNSWCSGNIVK